MIDAQKKKFFIDTITILNSDFDKYKSFADRDGIAEISAIFTEINRKLQITGGDYDNNNILEINDEEEEDDCIVDDVVPIVFGANNNLTASAGINVTASAGISIMDAGAKIKTKKHYRKKYNTKKKKRIRRQSSRRYRKLSRRQSRRRYT
jgi:N-acetyl-gamma-glutamylphosphate reductase